MIKNELFRLNDQFKRTAPMMPIRSAPPQPLTQAFQIKSMIGFRGSIDLNAIDIVSIRGRFAWEHISLSDTYMPVIFRYVDGFLIFERVRHDLAPVKMVSCSLVSDTDRQERIREPPVAPSLRTVKYCTINHRLIVLHVDMRAFESHRKKKREQVPTGDTFAICHLIQRKACFTWSNIPNRHIYYF